MSVGTIVTIVLLITVLILGLVLVRTIFSGSIENINSIDQAVKNEINKLFSEDSSRTIVVYPPTRSISIKEGEQGGFGFSIRNLESQDKTFRYDVLYDSSSCNINSASAQNLIVLGKTGNNINIASGRVLENPILVRFDISNDVPLCNIRYNIQVKDQTSGTIYGSTVSVDLEILPQ